MEERRALRYDRFLGTSLTPIQRGIRVVPAAGDQSCRPILVFNFYRYGLAGNQRFWREERGVQRWSWSPKPSCDEDAVNVRPVNVREVELPRGGRVN